MAIKRLILFDIDGTLLWPAGSGREATRLAMQEVFGTVGHLETYAFQGKTDYHTLVELLSPHGFTESQIVEVLPHYSETIVRHMHNIVGNFAIKALPGALELIEALAARSDVLLGLLTGNVPQMAEVKLRITGFDPSVFKIAAYGTEARIRRDLVPLAVSRAEQFAGMVFVPQDVVFVGDTPDDIDCAHSIGGKMIAVATGRVTREELERHQPVTVLESLTDLPGVLSLILD